jgi:ribosome recycling factor
MFLMTNLVTLSYNPETIDMIDIDIYWLLYGQRMLLRMIAKIHSESSQAIWNE